MKNYLIRLSVAFLLLLTISCSNQNLGIYKDRQPAFSAEEFFDGYLTAHGILKNRSGEVTRTFHATIDASWQEGVGTLKERFLFDDGEVQYRTWTLSPREDGRYDATAGDVVGIGIAATSGNAMHLNYVLRISYNGKPLELSVDDWMYRVDERTVINESVLTKWGFRVGYIQLAIIKHPLPGKVF
jgi:hypothetical protein